MKKLVSETLGLKSVVKAIVCGVLLSLATGLFENHPEISIIEAKYYGYPLVWRVTKTFQPTEFKVTNLTVDAVFWFAISFIALVCLGMLKQKLGFEYKTFITPIGLFVPLGFVMDFIHEFGHVMWGIAAGGKLTYMKIAFFEIYPTFGITSQFRLGFVEVEGLTTGFKYGLFLLGGSLTTNIVAWLLAPLLLRTRFGYKTKIALRIFGLFGLLDLPLYVVLPQIGLQHWIFLGGYQPEPLVGARKMGMPDPAFYLIVILSTLGLYFTSKP